jgi:ubiquinone/menaquinone biosynthesis C-methylase UbiE
MNFAHNRICSSGRWARRVDQTLLPWGLEGLNLGDDVLEVGPGFGATTRVLARWPGRSGRLSVLELDERYCRRLRSELDDAVDVTQGDATQLPYHDGRFSAAVCFTMLHHIPSPELQDRALAEIARVLAPGGLFAGTDSIGAGTRFKLIHIGDTLSLIDPRSLGERLRAAGLADPQVDFNARSMRFRAHRAL